MIKKGHLILLGVFILAIFSVRGLTKSYVPEDGCQGLVETGRSLCLEKEFKYILGSKGVEAGFDLLTLLYNGDATFPPTCHDYTHLIGQEAYKRYAKGERFKLTDAGSCGYGFYHGFIVSLFQDGKGKEEASEFCDWANKSLSTETSTTSLDCYHGIGHGMVDFSLGGASHGDTQKLVDQSLRLCRDVGASEREIGRCVNGVFHSSLGIMSIENASDVFAFCEGQKESDNKQCLSASSSFVMESLQGDFSKSALFTQNSLDTNNAGLVIRNMAGYEAYRAVNNAQKIRDDIKVCRALTLPLKEECIRGLIEGLTDFGVPGEEEKGVAVFCKEGQFREEESDFCLKHATDYFGDYFGPEKQQKLCQLIGAEYCLE